MKRKYLLHEDTFPNKKTFSIQLEDAQLIINTALYNNQFNPEFATASDTIMMDPPVAEPYVNLKRKYESHDKFSKRKKLHDNEERECRLVKSNDMHTSKKEYVCYRHDHDKQICAIYECIGSKTYNMPTEFFKEPCTYIS